MMRTLLACLLALLFSVQAGASDEAPAMPALKAYWFVVLKTGPSREHTAEQLQDIQRGHMAHMAAMAEAGKLLIAGPMGEPGEWRGLQIYDEMPREEVEALCAADPAVVAGRLVCDIRLWYSQPGGVLR